MNNMLREDIQRAFFAVFVVKAVVSQFYNELKLL